MECCIFLDQLSEFFTAQLTLSHGTLVWLKNTALVESGMKNKDLMMSKIWDFWRLHQPIADMNMCQYTTLLPITAGANCPKQAFTPNHGFSCEL